MSKTLISEPNLHRQVIKTSSSVLLWKSSYCPNDPEPDQIRIKCWTTSLQLTGWIHRLVPWVRDQDRDQSWDWGHSFSKPPQSDPHHLSQFTCWSLSDPHWSTRIHILNASLPYKPQSRHVWSITDTWLIICSMLTFRGTMEQRTRSVQKRKRMTEERQPFILSTWMITTARTWGRIKQWTMTWWIDRLINQCPRALLSRTWRTRVRLRISGPSRISRWFWISSFFTTK